MVKVIYQRTDFFIAIGNKVCLILKHLPKIKTVKWLLFMKAWELLSDAGYHFGDERRKAFFYHGAWFWELQFMVVFYATLKYASLPIVPLFKSLTLLEASKHPAVTFQLPGAQGGRLYRTSPSGRSWWSLITLSLRQAESTGISQTPRSVDSEEFIWPLLRHLPWLWFMLQVCDGCQEVPL